MPPVTKKPKARAPRNRTLEVEKGEVGRLLSNIKFELDPEDEKPRSKILCADAFRVLPLLEPNSFDLMFADPPYNLSKTFGTKSLQRTTSDKYEEWLDSWLRLCVPLLKATASVYICGDWRSAAAIERAGSKYLRVQNRLTWEREKGRGAKANWKNAAEDIWFFTVSDDFTFNLDAVKMRRRVLAPYRENGSPKDWCSAEDGNYRDTHPSNIWTDISVPFWSMPENTDHPTQKPEK